MPIRGPLTHIDLTISDPDRAIPFYDALFGAAIQNRLGGGRGSAARR